jgi:hypothetical protein
MGINCLTVS